MGIVCNGDKFYMKIGSYGLDKFLVADSKVIYQTTFTDCNFVDVDINNYGFLECEFINCRFNELPEYARWSTYENCSTAEDRREACKTIFELSQMLNKKPKDDINETKEEGLQIMYPQIKLVDFKVFDKNSFEELQLNQSKVIYNTFFMGCNFSGIDIQSLAFLKCFFLKCLFKEYPSIIKDSTFFQCDYDDQRHEDALKLQKLSELMLREIKE